MAATLESRHPPTPRRDELPEIGGVPTTAILALGAVMLFAGFVLLRGVGANFG